jgi:hypothetical protein
MHLESEAWAAIESYKRRLERASSFDDRPGVVGAAKDLIECIARVVVLATGATVSDSAEFSPLVREAQRALKRQAGGDVGQSEEVRAISNAALAMASAVAPIRNRVGNGHGRARLEPIDEEMLSLVVDAAMLWCRWALRRLGHLLAQYPHSLVTELTTKSSQVGLQAAFDGVRIFDQPADIQHYLGVTLGRSAAGGYGNAFVVGLEPMITGSSDSFPVAYRLGLVDGIVLDGWGQIALMPHVVPWLVTVLASVPPGSAVGALSELAEKSESATWITKWRQSVVDPENTMAALAADKVRLEPNVEAGVDELMAAIDPARRAS